MKRKKEVEEKINAERRLINVKFEDRPEISRLDHSSLYTMIDTDALNILPQRWPKCFVQRGPNCGIYALHGSLTYSHVRITIPPPRKEGSRRKTSIRQIAKRKRTTFVGEIFNVESFSVISRELGLDQGVVEKLDRASYTDAILKSLSENNSVIVGCDKVDDNFPCNNRGYTTHWALVFGSCVIRSKRYFLVTQYSQYYLWSAKELHASNLNLPVRNPRCSPSVFAYKCGDRHIIATPNDIKKRKLIPKKRVPLVVPTLENLRFCIFSFPSQALKQRDEIPQTNPKKKIKLKRR